MRIPPRLKFNVLGDGLESLNLKLEGQQGIET